MTSDFYAERLAIYDQLVAMSTKFDRKGKTMPYTSANGYMFSQLNKAGEIGIRLRKDEQQAFFEEHSTTVFKSYGAVMNGYVLVPDRMLEDLSALAVYLDAGYEYVMSLEPK
jgi:hypothetical protein